MRDDNTLLPGNQVLSIDVLRFIAAMLVLALHFGTLATTGPDPRLAGILDQSLLPVSNSPLTNFGWIGVEIFFVISGYVIAISAERSARSDFLRRRFLRLAPAAWICGTFTLILLLVTTEWSRPLLLMEWLFTISLWPVGEAIDPSYWTIGIEIAFYAIVGTQLRGGDQARRLNRLAIIIGVISSAFAVAVQLGWTNAAPGRLWQLLLVQHGCLFALGMMLRTSSTYGWTARRAAFCIVLMFACFVEIQGHQVDPTLTPASISSPAILIFVAAILVILSAPLFQTMLSGPAVRRPIILLGKTTYPLYLIHRTAGSVLIGGLLNIGVGGLAAIAITTLVALIVAMLIATKIEPAVRAYAARSFFNRAPRPDTPQIAFPSGG